MQKITSENLIRLKQPDDVGLCYQISTNMPN